MLAASIPPALAVVLPHGVWHEGRLERALALRALTGADEVALADAAEAGAMSVELALLLLGRLGAAPEALVAGDIEVTLRAVHAATFGPVAELALPCRCGEALEVELPLAALVVPVPPPPPNGRHPFGAGDIRLPTGHDLALAARAATPAVALAAAIGIGPDDDLDAAEVVLAAADPNAECLIDLACPACASPMQLAVDSLALLRRGLAAGGGIDAQVDLLARVYGWSEAEILALPRARRQRYLALAAA